MTTPQPAATEPDYAQGPRIGGTTRLDANELPFPPPPQVMAALLTSPPLHRYGDPECSALLSALVRELEVPSDTVLLGNGSSAILQRLITTTCTAPGDAVIWATPGFGAIDHFVRQAGASSQQIPVTPLGATDLDAMLQAITPATRVVVLVNPHNPTGTILTAAQVRGFLDRVDPDVTVVIDEAYREFSADIDPAGTDITELATVRWPAGRHIAVVRTFSKAYGLADMRVGYGIAPPELAQKVRGAAIPRELGGLAMSTALAALQAKTAMRENVTMIVQERQRVHDALGDLGYAPFDSHANFLFLPLGDDAARFAHHCQETGVHLLCIPEHGVRVTIGSQIDNDTFLRAAFTWAGAPTAAETISPRTSGT